MGRFETLTDRFEDIFNISDAKQVILGCFAGIFVGYVTPTTPAPLWLSVSLIAGVFILMIIDVKKVGIIQHIALAFVVSCAVALVLGVALYQTKEMIATIALIGIIGGLTADAILGG